MFQLSYNIPQNPILIIEAPMLHSKKPLIIQAPCIIGFEFAAHIGLRVEGLWPEASAVPLTLHVTNPNPNNTLEESEFKSLATP